jgi:hypothetical protein
MIYKSILQASILLAPLSDTSHGSQEATHWLQHHGSFEFATIEYSRKQFIGQLHICLLDVNATMAHLWMVQCSTVQGHY